MDRRLSLVIVVLLLLAGANVRAAWQENLDAACKKAQAAGPAAGTPEMTFANVVRAPPGQTVSVLAQGVFVKGTQFIVERDDVDVVTQKITERGWEATLRMSANAWPGTVAVTAVVPGCKQTTEIAARVEARYAIDFDIANGWKGHVTATGPVDDGRYEGEGKFFHAGEKAPFRTSKVLVQVGDVVRVEVPLTEGELASTMQDSQTMMKAANPEDTMAQLTPLTEKMMAECGKLPPEKMQPCMEPYQKKIQALSDGMEKRLAAAKEGTASVRNQRTFGCSAFSLRREKGAVVGEASDCEGVPQQALKNVQLTLTK